MLLPTLLRLVHDELRKSLNLCIREPRAKGAFALQHPHLMSCELLHSVYTQEHSEIAKDNISAQLFTYSLRSSEISESLEI